LIYLRNDGAKDYKKVLQDFLREDGITYEVTERHCPESNGLAERMNLTDGNLTLKLWLYAAHYAMLMYDNIPHPALDNHKSPNDAYGDSSDFSKPYVFGSICFALEPSQLLYKLKKRSEKGLFLEIDPAG